MIVAFDKEILGNLLSENGKKSVAENNLRREEKVDRMRKSSFFKT